MKKIDLTEQMRNRYESRMRKVLNVKDHLQYNRDPEYGEIGSWILTSARGIKDAIKLMVEKGCPIYIHTTYGSALFKWNYYEQEWQMELWQNQKQIESETASDIREVETQMKKWWKRCKYNKE